METKTPGPTKTDNRLPSVDRPDILRHNVKSALTFKELRDALYKFLMQINVAFVPTETIELFSDFKTKAVNGNSRFRAGEIRTTCRLLDITVDGQPVYIIIQPYNDQYQSQKDKLLYFQQFHKAIIFDSEDWSKIGLDISGKQWLAPLSKKTLKTWSKLLLSRLRDLGEDVRVNFSLNDLYQHIDLNFSLKEKEKSTIASLQESNLTLKSKLVKIGLSKYGLIKDESIYKKIAAMPAESLKWLAQTLNQLVPFLLKVDLNKPYYRELFLSNKKRPTVFNVDKVTEYLAHEITKNKLGIEYILLNDGIIKLKNPKTLQEATLYIAPERRIITVPPIAEFKLNDLSFLVCIKGNVTDKIEQVVVETFLRKTKRSESVSLAERVVIYDTEEDSECSWGDYEFETN